MSEIQIQSRCVRCSELFLLRPSANYSDLCDSCQRFTGLHSSEASIIHRNRVYREFKQMTGETLEGKSAATAQVFLPGLRADEPAPSVSRMRSAIRNVRDSSSSSGGK